MLNVYRDTAETIARRAGALLLDYAARGENQTRTKSTEINLVTAADKASEALIIEALQAAFPDHHIHGEEGGGYGPARESAPFRWYVDPLDGTTNFAHGVPIYAVNLSLVDPAGEPVVGVTYDPNQDECFSAVRGQGATRNGRPVRVSQTADLRQALLASGFAYDRVTARDNNAQAWAAFVRRAQGMRRTGAAALDLAYVACGRFDGYWERGPEAWDIMAGVLFVREAGGMASAYDGSTTGLEFRRDIVATNRQIHGALLDVLAEVQAALAASGS
ncbi:MAG: inositol monophosphatase [Anaerolineae bacterium]|nr:inositol monophosphatase [Anaerolineae bacterium]